MEKVSVLEALESFNRKERYFVVCAVIDAPALPLGDLFRRRVERAFNVTIGAPVFAAIDYHQDWLMAALMLAHGEIVERHAQPDPTGLITGNQEDVDLLLAFEGPDTTHLIMLEAKTDTGYTNKQMVSKASHLAAVFGAAGDRFPKVTPHFGLLSPRSPARLVFAGWPTWMAPSGKPVWLQLKLPAERRRVTRCDASGVPSRVGGHFVVSSRFCTKSPTTV